MEEFAGLLRSDDRRPGGLTQIPRQNGPLHDMGRHGYTLAHPGTRAEGTAYRKYQELAVTHSFILLAFKTSPYHSSLSLAATN